MIKKLKIKRACGHFTKVLVHDKDAEGLVKRYRHSLCDTCERKKYLYPEIETELQPEVVFAVVGGPGPVTPPPTEPDEDEFNADDLDISDLFDEGDDVKEW